MLLEKLKHRFKKPKKVLSLQVLTDRCVGCGVCVERCKREVFAMDRAGELAVVANLEACVGCGKCVEKFCKMGAIELNVES